MNVPLMPLRSAAAPGSSAIRWLPLTMREEHFDFDDHCSNSLSPIADCFHFPFEEYDFVAVDDLDFFNDVVSVGGDSAQGSLGWAGWGCVGCGSRSGCGVERSISICVYMYIKLYAIWN